MNFAEDFANRSRKIAQRFLQTAVVVDDEAIMPRGENEAPVVEITGPDRHTRVSSQDENESSQGDWKHSLNARSIMDAFSALGVICGVVGPSESELETIRLADVVILDWLLRDGKSEYTLNLLDKMLTGARDRNSLRLVAIYTGVGDLKEISQTIFGRLEDNSLDPKRENGTTIHYRHGLFVFYAKTDTKNILPEMLDRCVSEEVLPGRLVEDFASLTKGLVANIALTSLTAVREGEHKILDRFCAELDPAFLAHMSCLTEPEDAERQIVSHIADELRGLIDERIAAKSPAGIQAAEDWLRSDGRETFSFGQKQFNLDQTVKLVSKGLKESGLGESNFKHLSAGFSNTSVECHDERLAWIMSFQTVYNAPAPILWLGSVVTLSDEEEGICENLICITPRCDSLRLNEETSFLFLPLIEPSKKLNQLVVRSGKKFRRLGIKIDSSSLVRRRFNPAGGSRQIVAVKKESGGDFEFEDTCNRKYIWRGELKAEYAQRIAQIFAITLSRIAIDKSEWLRRHEPS